MLKIMKELWDKNQDKLRTELSSRDDLNECSYVDLVKIAFDKIYLDVMPCNPRNHGETEN